MHNLLTKLFQKRGIKSVKELTKEEKIDFDNWDKILSKEDLTIEDIKKFCRAQCDVIKSKWKNLDLDNKKKAEMIPYFTVYETLLAVINSPKVEREILEKQLIELTK